MDTITVLVVDDHPLAREGLRAMLETDRGVQVVGEAADGQEALERAAALRPTVVLMDIRMPRMDGLEATRLLKRDQPATAVVVMTSYDDDELVVAALRAGATGYLLKDTSRALLIHTIGAAASGGLLVSARLLHRALHYFDQAAPPEKAGSPSPGRMAPFTGREQVLSLAAEGHRLLRKAPGSFDALAPPDGTLLPSPEEMEPLTRREQEVLRMVAEGRTNKKIGEALALAEVTIKKHVQSIIAKLHAADRTHAATVAMRVGLIR